MAKSKITTVLFGLDGVVVDTEHAYDEFWSKIAQENELKINNFSDVIKGMTLSSIIELYFTISTETIALPGTCGGIDIVIGAFSLKVT